MKHGFLILAHKYNSAVVCLIDFSEADPSRNDPPKTFGIKNIDRVVNSPAWIVRKVDDALAKELYRLNKKNTYGRN